MFKHKQKGSAQWIWIVIIIIVLVIVAIALRSGAPADEQNTSTTTDEGVVEENTNTPSHTPEFTDNNQHDPGMTAPNQQVTISYTDSGFEPSTVEINQGDSVVFVNNSSRDMWPASAMHPTHTVYSGTSLSEHCPDPEGDNFDACERIAPGDSWSFTFGQAGEWGFHDHLAPNNWGKIIVNERPEGSL